MLWLEPIQKGSKTKAKTSVHGNSLQTFSEKKKKKASQQKHCSSVVSLDQYLISQQFNACLLPLIVWIYMPLIIEPSIKSNVNNHDRNYNEMIYLFGLYKPQKTTGWNVLQNFPMRQFYWLANFPNQARPPCVAGCLQVLH